MFKTINKDVVAEIVEKKSKFIAHVFHVETVEEAEEKIKEIKKMHYDARHNCYAFSIFSKEGIVNRFSDDGEPSGTAGSPMLNILNSKGITNCVVIVTRYFGGILLGTGGLVRAYTGAMQEALKEISEVIKDTGLEVRLQTTYQDLEKMKYYLELRSLYKKNISQLTELDDILEATNIEKTIDNESILSSNNEYYSFISQYKSYRNELESKQKYYERQVVLYPSVLSKQEIENIENDYIQTKLNFINWIEEKKIETVEKKMDYSQKLNNIEIEIQQTQLKIDNSSIKAKKSGYVNVINKISVGDYVSSDTLLLSIIPVDTELKAIVNVSNSNISKIKIGQNVLLQINDLPYTKYGKIEGKIILIPSDVIISENPYYPVEVLLDKNYVKHKSEKVYLKIGTKVSTKIIVDSNTIFQKILNKLVIDNEQINSS